MPKTNSVIDKNFQLSSSRNTIGNYVCHLPKNADNESSADRTTQPPSPRVTPFSAFLCCSYPNPHPHSEVPPTSPYSVLIRDIDLLANVLMDSRGISAIVDFHIFFYYYSLFVWAYRNDFLLALFAAFLGSLTCWPRSFGMTFYKSHLRKLTNKSKIEFFLIRSQK